MNETIHFKKFLRLIGQNLYAVRIAHNKDLETVAMDVKIIPEVNALSSQLFEPKICGVEMTE